MESVETKTEIEIPEAKDGCRLLVNDTSDEEIEKTEPDVVGE